MHIDENDLIALRRDLHQHPELSHHEARTAGVVAERLRALGLEPRTGVAGHGIIADLVGSHPGPTLLYRADMDALPIDEAEDRPYRSCNPGVMHACGHDVHTTIGVGVATALASVREQLKGRVRFVFQPAEEAAPPPGAVIGAERMVREGALEGPPVDAAFALHVMPLLPVGQIAGTGGAVWAASDLFDIHIDGAMAHGAYPHEGVDPVLCAAHVIASLQQIVSRNIDAREPTVVSVCRVQGGSAYNVIPARVTLQGLVRTLSDATRAVALARLREVAEGVAAAHGCRATVTTVRGTLLTANDPGLERRTLASIERSRVAEVTSFQPQMGAEDFAAFSTRVPGCYLFLGVRNEERGIVHMIHTPRFDVDERCIGIGVRAMAGALLEASAGA
jgi:amidohydrolase